MKVMLIFLVAVLFLSCGGTAPPTLIVITDETNAVELVAHRGIGDPDNTIASFTNALNLGFTSLETDLRMQDGSVVLAHDKATNKQKYLSLEDFLIFASNNNARVWLEAKETETIKPMIELLKMHNLDVVFFSLRQTDLDLAKSLMPDIVTGLLITREEQIDSIDADWIVIYHPFIKRNYEKIKHLKIAAWTFREQSEYDHLSHLIDAAISDIQLIQ
jgi:glycerophosphoryl diester phosphodiesterase